MNEKTKKRLGEICDKPYACNVCGLETKSHLKDRGSKRVVNLHNGKGGTVCEASWKEVL